MIDINLLTDIIEKAFDDRIGRGHTPSILVKTQRRELAEIAAKSINDYDAIKKVSPLSINTEEIQCLRNEGLGIFEAAREARVNAIRAEIEKPEPNFGAIILTLLEIIK